MELLKRVVGFGSLVFVLSSPVAAAPITYEVHGYGSGTFEGIAFSDQLVSVMFSGSTSTIAPNGPGLFVNKTGVGSVTVVGIGQEILLNAYAYASQSVNGSSFAGIATTDEGATVLATDNSTFGTYALGAIGPVVGRPFFRPDKAFPTDVGETFQLTSIGDTTFSATVSAVPLPASAPMFGAAIFALGMVSYSVKRKKAALSD